MSKEGKIRVFVRSCKVPARTIEVSDPVYGPWGVRIGTKRSRMFLYEYVLNEEHKRAIEEGHRVSCNLGLDLEVVDVTKRGLLGRLLSLLGRNGSREPVLLVSPNHYRPGRETHLTQEMAGKRQL